MAYNKMLLLATAVGLLVAVECARSNGFLRQPPVTDERAAPRTGARPAVSLGAFKASGKPAGQTCDNGSVCDGGEQCCNNGAMCCPGNTTCCQDTCCSNSTDYRAETCCPDPKNGGVCCLSENTFCCAPNPELDQPSRCCPRWYVCCAQGRYGCCNPTTGLSLDQEDALAHLAAGGGAAPHAFALLEETNAWTDSDRLWGATVSLINATYTQVKVKTGVFHTDQEMTRRFMFRRATNTFLLLQANFTDPTLDYPILLYTIDPTTGAASKASVVGAHDEVTGMHYVEEVDKILMATWWISESGTKIGYKFYSVDPVTAAATLLSKVNNSDYTTPDDDTYAGWFHEASPDMKYVYRVGFASEVNDIDYGLGVVDISEPTAKVLRWTSLQDPRFHGRLRTLHRFTNSTPAASSSVGRPLGNGSNPWDIAFASLAQSNNVTTDGDLALYTWNPSDLSSVRLLVQLGNAHLQAYFGPIAEAVDPTRTKYAAAVVQDSLLGDSFDTWELLVADLLTGQSAVVPLSPTVLASTSSISGFGVPTSAGSVFDTLRKA